LLKSKTLKFTNHEQTLAVKGIEENSVEIGVIKRRKT
jgi:hypothetical protein